MIRKIIGETPFSILNNGCSISPSSEGYTLQYSADGVSFSAWEKPTPANEVLVVTGLPLLPIYFRLKGNNSEVIVNY